MRKDYTTRDLQRIKDMYAAGATIGEIAEEVGRPYGSVAAKLQALRKEGDAPPPRHKRIDWAAVEPEIVRRWQAGEPLRRIARAVGLHHEAVYTRIITERRRGRWDKYPQHYRWGGLL